MARKKKRSILRSVFFIIFALTLVSVGIYYIIRFLTTPTRIEYPEFGIDIPPDYSIHGIDVSHYQRVIDWRDVKDMKVENIKIGFAFIKATEGIGKVDPAFQRNWLQAEQRKIPRGAYHFFIAGKSGKAQAENFMEIVKLKKGDLPPVLDIEKTYGANEEAMVKEISEWLNKVEAHYGIKPIIYTNIYFYNRYLKSFDEYPFWIAHYLQPDKPRLKRKWIFWQHSERGRVNGIKSKVDFNVFSGDSSDFNELLLK